MNHLSRKNYNEKIVQIPFLRNINLISIKKPIFAYQSWKI